MNGHSRRSRASRVLDALSWAARGAQLIIVFALASGAAVAAHAKVPTWVAAAAAAKVDASLGESGGVVLLDEMLLDVHANGSRTLRVRGVVRVNTRDGCEMAKVRAPYLVGGQRVETAQAWLIRPGGKERSYARKEFSDEALYYGDLYSESRRLALDAAAEALPGSVFAWETVTTDNSIFPDGRWFFAGEHPVVLSRFSVRLPVGWKVEGRIFNHGDVQPRVVGQETTWGLRDLKQTESEPWAPSPRTRAPILGYRLLPPAEGKLKVKMNRYQSWADVSHLLAGFADPAVVVDASIRAKAEELTRDVTGPRERVAAIARFVQRINYVSISARLHAGGGLMPHPAPRVLQCNYGDCKDKATLMRALLSAIGIESHYVAVASDDQPVIWKDWPSPGQFNHAIVAVRIPEEIGDDAITVDPELGRLLFFDPTDPYTSFGDLPGHYQGSAALVVAGANGRLIDLPVIPVSSHAFRRTIEATLHVDGAIQARVVESSHGQSARLERVIFAESSGSDYARVLANWVTETVRGAKIENVETRDDPDAGTFDLSFNLQARSYAQSMGARLLVFKPVMLSRRSFTPLTEAKRVQPVWIQGRTISEEITVALPAGCTVSELGSSITLEESFGEYALAISEEDGKIRVVRTLRLRTTTVPQSEYARVRAFFMKIIGAEQQPVVLERSQS